MKEFFQLDFVVTFSCLFPYIIQEIYTPLQLSVSLFDGVICLCLGSNRVLLLNFVISSRLVVFISMPYYFLKYIASVPRFCDKLWFPNNYFESLKINLNSIFVFLAQVYNVIPYSSRTFILEFRITLCNLMVNHVLSGSNIDPWSI